MIKFLSALLVSAAVMAPACAAPAGRPIAFENEGVHFVGTVTDRTDGTSLIAGHEVESGREFALTVAKGVVSGTYDREFVSYPAPRKGSAAASTGM